MPLKTGVDPVEQLSGIFSASNVERDRLIKIAGFVCPLYEIDESKLSEGFGSAIVDIGVGDLEQFPRYERKFNRLMALISQMNELLGGKFKIELDIIMGDKGVVNAGRFSQELERITGRNMDSYKTYLSTYYPEFSRMANLSFVSDLVAAHYPDLGKQFSDLVEDGKYMSKGGCGFDINERVTSKVMNELAESRKKGLPEHEVLGFLINYGLAGKVCRENGVDILVGVDKPGSYMNYLYHAFVNPRDLFVLVPK